MKRIDTGRVVIVGAGLAAQYAALHLAPRPVLMISPEPLGQGASSAWAQGGVAAAMDPADSAAAHALPHNLPPMPVIRYRPAQARWMRRSRNL